MHVNCYWWFCCWVVAAFSFFFILLTFSVLNTWWLCIEVVVWWESGAESKKEKGKREMDVKNELSSLETKRFFARQAREMDVMNLWFLLSVVFCFAFSFLGNAFSLQKATNGKSILRIISLPVKSCVVAVVVVVVLTMRQEFYKVTKKYYPRPYEKTILCIHSMFFTLQFTHNQHCHHHQYHDGVENNRH